MWAPEHSSETGCFSASEQLFFIFKLAAGAGAERSVPLQTIEIARKKFFEILSSTAGDLETAARDS